MSLQATHQEVPNLPTDGCVLGIDVGYSQDRTSTGICLLSWTEKQISWCLRLTGSTSVSREADLRDVISKGKHILGVGIDGPLVRILVIASGYRCAVALFSKGKFQRRGSAAPTTSDSLLHRHATDLAKLVKTIAEDGYWTVSAASHPDPIDSYRIIEAHPVGFLNTLVEDDAFPERVGRGKASDLFFAYAAARGTLSRILGDLLPARRCLLNPFRVTNHDERAALICALTALCVAADQYVMAGDPTDGSIFVSPKKYWGRDGAGRIWGEVELRENAKSITEAAHKKSKLTRARYCRILENGTNWI